MLAQLDDWRAILWSLIVLVFLLLLFGAGVSMIVIRRQSMALTVALQATRDSTAALLENAKSERDLAAGLNMQASIMARVEPLLTATDERWHRSDQIMRRLEARLEDMDRSGRDK